MKRWSLWIGRWIDSGEVIRRLIALFLAVGLSLVAVGNADALMADQFLPRRVYVLNGSLGLNYDRYWYSGQSGRSVDSYYYSLNLNLKGFLIDSRLISFDLGGTFAQSFLKDSDIGRFDSSATEGFNLNVTLLQHRPKTTILKYFPGPIGLFYTYYTSENSSSSGYGISVSDMIQGYKVGGSEKTRSSPQKRRSDSDDNENDQNNDSLGNSNNNSENRANREIEKERKPRLIIPPIRYQIDYNRNEYRSEDNASATDRFSVRAQTRTEHGYYAADYHYYGFENSAGSSSRQQLLFEANHNYYWKETHTTLSNMNRLHFENFEAQKTTAFSSSTSWLRNLGAGLKDYLQFTGGAGYVSRETSAYSLNMGGTYNKFFSERFRDSMSLSGAYGQSEDDSYYGVTVSNSFDYKILNNLSISNSFLLGFNEAGMTYGFNISMPVRFSLGRISISPGYSFRQSGSNYSEDKGAGHRFGLNISGFPTRDLQFMSETTYNINTSTGDSWKAWDKTLTIQSALYWNVSRYNISLGASYLKATSSVSGNTLSDDMLTAPAAGSGKFSVLTLTAGISTMWSRNLSLKFHAYYQSDSESLSRLSLSPSLSWQFRKISLTARYIADIREHSDISHRFMVRLVRYFDGIIRPFWR